MQSKITIGLMVFIGLLTFSSINYASDDDYTRAYDRGDKSSSPMIFFRNESGEVDMETVVRGSRSTIYRYDDRLDFTIDTHQLPSGTYTVWMMVFDNPEACSPPACGEDDLFPDPSVRALDRDRIEAAQISGFWVTGGIVGTDGLAHFADTVKVGELPGQILFGPTDGNYFENPRGADVMFQVRYHGPAVWDMPEQLGLQITSLRGYCADFKEHRLPHNENAVGCYETQLSLHSKLDHQQMHHYRHHR